MNISFDVSGMNIDAVIAEIEARLRKGVTDAGLRVERTAKRLAPRDTGQLQNSIQFELDESDKEGVAIGHVGVGGGDVNYAIWVHEGTGIHSRTGMGRKDVPWGYIDEELTERSADGKPVVVWTDGIEPNPFLEDAYNAERNAVQRIIARAVKGEGL